MSDQMNDDRSARAIITLLALIAQKKVYRTVDIDMIATFSGVDKDVVENTLREVLRATKRD